MAEPTARQRIWGWFFFDWASQPYNTLLLTFIFAPYMKDLLGDGASAQSAWGYSVGAAGLVIAVLAPLLGAVADKGRGRMRWIWLFSGLYVVCAASLWIAAPADPNVLLVLVLFGIGLIGMEFATTFTNAMLPSLGSREEIGRISGSGWAFGYVGGLIALVVMLAFFAEGKSGLTLIGLPPLFGLDPEAREGTRFVGPFTAIWYVVFIIPFFVWVRERPRPDALPFRPALATAVPELKATLRGLPQRPNLFRFLGASMFYRDALAGMYAFGGIYATGVLDWDVESIGTFGILAIICSALFAWLGGRVDSAIGPKPVVTVSLVLLTLLAVAVVFIRRDSVFGLSVAPGSALPDLAFYAVGAILGAAGGTLQAASRTMMCQQTPPGEETKSFGLYALAGKATAFIAPLSVGVVTDLTGSQPLGITPMIGLFLLGLILLVSVQPDGDRAA